MDAMRADMGGAATVCASIITAAALNLPVNIIGGLPLSNLFLAFFIYFYCPIIHVFTLSRSGPTV